MYVDGLWVQEARRSRAEADFQPLLEEIAARTGLPIALDGIYRWVAFLPSRVDAAPAGRQPLFRRLPGRQPQGARHRSPPPRYAALHRPHPDADPARSWRRPRMRRACRASCPRRWPCSITRPACCVRAGSRSRSCCVDSKAQPHAGRIPRALSRGAAPLPSSKPPVKPPAPGSISASCHTRGSPGVHAWDRQPPPAPAALDTTRYLELLLRAASSVLGPLGVDENTLRQWLFSCAAYGGAAGGSAPRQAAPAGPGRRAAQPKARKAPRNADHHPRLLGVAQHKVVPGPFRLKWVCDPHTRDPPIFVRR